MTKDFYETPFQLKDGRILLIKSEKPFPMGECPMQIKDAALFSQDEYQALLVLRERI